MLLVLRPQSLQRVNQQLNRWVSTRHLDHSLERSVNVDPWFYHYRRVSGVLTLLGAIYILYFFTMNMDRANTIHGLSKHFGWPALLVEGLLDALALSALLGATCAAIVALFVLFRPSLLRDFERSANQWVSLRKSLKPVEIRREGVDEYVFKHRHQAGALLVLGSLYVLALLLLWFGH